MAKVVFTAGRVTGFKCAPDKQQAFLWDLTAPGLGLRATPAGKPAYIFQSQYQSKTIRLTIGSPEVWSIEQARTKAKDLQRLIDDGKDPRDLKRDNLHAKAQQARQDAAQALTVGEVWAVYLAERKLHWGERHYHDHVVLSRAGGEVAQRGTRGLKVTIDMPLVPLLAMPLRDLKTPVIEAWAAKQATTRPTSARLAWRLLKAFLTWCSEQAEYAPLVAGGNAAKSKKARESLGKAGIKQDALLKEQLPAWFEAVRQLQNPVVAAYLQILLMTGARPGEVLTLRWDDISTKWHGLTIRDKVEGERIIPLTKYVEHLIAGLPRRNAWVFSSTTAEAGALTIPRNHHTAACKVAGIDGLTLHGLRRSFKSLTEWLEIPAGVVAQLMGHKPSATAEKHYTVRPLDLLRVHHEKIEAWILEQAGVTFDRASEPGKLRVMAI